MLSRFTSKHARHYAPNWFNCPIVCPFRAKSGKYYPKKRVKLLQLRKEITIIALRFYLIRGKLRLLQTSLNMLWSMFNRLWPTCSIPLEYFCPNPRVSLNHLNIRGQQVQGDIDFDSNLSMNLLILVKLAYATQRLKKISKKIFVMISKNCHCTWYKLYQIFNQKIQ